MTIEENLQQIIEAKIKDGTLEKLVSDKFEESIKKAIEDIFRWGDAEKALKEKLNSIYIPAIEKYDYSKHIVKLDTVLTEVINNTSLSDNKKILENFKVLMTEQPEEMKLSDLFHEWGEYVADEVETIGLDVSYDDGVSYEYVEVEMLAEEQETYSKHSPTRYHVAFTCEHDEDMNVEFELYKYDFMKGYEIRKIGELDIRGLRHMNRFTCLLSALERASTKIEIDVERDSDDILPTKEPEASFS